MSAMNSAIYWTEYVLKFKGALHLKPSSMKLYWFSQHLLDVFLLSTLIVVLIIYVIIQGYKKFLEIRKDQKRIQKKKKK